MFLQKFVKNGKKFVKIGEIEAELAPREVVEKYIAENIVPPESYQADIKLDKTEAEPNEKININGWFSEDEEGIYRVYIWVYDANNRKWKWGKLIGTVTIKKKKENDKKITKIKAADIVNYVKNSLKERAKSANFFLADSEYYPADVNKLVESIKEAKVAEKVYVKEEYDCDDFTFAAMGVWHMSKELARTACFIVWTWWKENDKFYAHSLNAAFDGKELYLIEPQNYSVFKFPSNWNLTLIMG